ncbi:MAG: Ryanodine receptor Ryr [Rikenellaceae bacterium]|nr:Ryanodine receptor Ryr [Rikenellaceae bacterium]MBQ3259715.1 Ryanodine receptor Ryr [Alistipes sp.]
MKANYTPQPVDTSNVVLPTELDELVEVMAKNVHEVWAQTRIKQGWQYGSERNDEQKIHPCLVEYEALPESEREYDRNTAIGTLKLIVKLGFEISPKRG